MSEQTTSSSNLLQRTFLPEGLHRSLQPHSRLLAAIGAALITISVVLPWCYVEGPLENLALLFNPAPLQYVTCSLGLIALVMLFVSSPLGQHVGRSFEMGPGLRVLGVGSLSVFVLIAIAIGVESGALANVEYGLIVGLVGAVLLTLGAFAYDPAAVGHGDRPQVHGALAGLALALGIALAFFVCVFVLEAEDPWIFFLTIVLAVVVTTAMIRAEIGTWIGEMAQDQRRVLTLSVFVAAFCLPITQSGSNANMSVAVQVLIFAATAVGLNIVVGLAGLLDLGYIAFLGAGAYVGAMLSRSAFATIDWHPPFIVVMLIGAAVSATLGLIIGSPTLRVSGDYLAIVTLAFGEIFRLIMLNMDGTNGPDLTHGPNGISAIPHLNILGFDFGKSHTIGGIEITRDANYYLLLLLIMAFIILVFTRLNESRIGRGWVAIREDEKAAEAMGVNVFGLKLLAFAGGAALAGTAGTVKAHVDTSVVPEQYMFLESAFLLAAVVLGGMGTVTGVIVGAVLLKLLPEKLRFFDDYRLFIFGLLLVVMMRFRPEGLIRVVRRHPADDYPEAVEAGKLRPLGHEIVRGGGR